MKMNLVQVIKNICSGAVVGVANAIPGVSGGTMAVVLNVFDQMMETLGLKKFKKNLGFLLTFGLGMVLGIVAFSSVIKWLLQNCPAEWPSYLSVLIFQFSPFLHWQENNH